jgi:hypothetical protein
VKAFEAEIFCDSATNDAETDYTNIFSPAASHAIYTLGGEWLTRLRSNSGRRNPEVDSFKLPDPTGIGGLKHTTCVLDPAFAGLIRVT